ncbi:hypothetical protein NDU88_000864, partial [Pleurodeles waltl]
CAEYLAADGREYYLERKKKHPEVGQEHTSVKATEAPRAIGFPCQGPALGGKEEAAAGGARCRRRSGVRERVPGSACQGARAGPAGTRPFSKRPSCLPGLAMASAVHTSARSKMDGVPKVKVTRFYVKRLGTGMALHKTALRSQGCRIRFALWQTFHRGIGGSQSHRLLALGHQPPPVRKQQMRNPLEKIPRKPTNLGHFSREHTRRRYPQGASIAGFNRPDYGRKLAPFIEAIFE